MPWLRGLLFTVVMYAAALVGSSLVVLLFWAPHNARWAVAKGLGVFSAYGPGVSFAGSMFRRRVRRTSRTSPASSLIKHTTALETYWQIVAHYRRHPGCLKRELLWLPVFGLVARPVDAIHRH